MRDRVPILASALFLATTLGCSMTTFTGEARPPVPARANEDVVCSRVTRQAVETLRDGTVAKRFCVRVESNGEPVAHGWYSEWYPNGTKKTQGLYQMGKKFGTWKSWHWNGNLESEGVFLNDWQNGVFRTYYPNGNKKSEGHFKDGKHHGKYTAWHMSGAVRFEAEYVEGKENGRFISTYSNGRTWLQGDASNGTVTTSE